MKFLKTIFFVSYSAIAIAQSFIQHEISSTGTNTVHITDLDGDGKTDLITTNYTEIIWHQNIDYTSFERHVLSSNRDYSKGVYSIDIDSDDDIDLFFAEKDKIFWYENDGYQNFTKFIIDEDITNASQIKVIDIDSDGYLDVFGASTYVPNDDGIAYSIIKCYKNNGNQDFSTILIDTSYPLSSIETIDVDDDGDIDIAVSLEHSNRIYWYEYKNTSDQSFVKHTVNSSSGRVYGMSICDIDGDNDVDIISANRSGSVSSGEKNFTAFLNDGHQNFTSTNILDIPGYITPKDVMIFDLDQDGDQDMISTYFNPKKISWQQNIGNQEFIDFEIASDLTISDFCSIDFDQDGDNDIIIASQQKGLFWYERPNLTDADWDGYPINDDCDDENPLVNPNGQEIINNEIDEDCDGIALSIVAQSAVWCNNRTVVEGSDEERFTSTLLTSDSTVYTYPQTLDS